MPRQGARASSSGSDSTILGTGRNGEGGYEMVEVCTYCTPMLQGAYSLQAISMSGYADKEFDDL
jgi:hypothetical protein